MSDIGGASRPITLLHSHPSSSIVPTEFALTGTLPLCDLAWEKNSSRTFSAATLNLVPPDSSAAAGVSLVMAGGHPHTRISQRGVTDDSQRNNVAYT